MTAAISSHSSLFSLLLHSYNRDLGKSFVKGWSFEFRSHAPNDVLGHNSVTALVTLNADFERHIEEHGLHFIAVVFCQLDPIMALLRREIGGVHIIHRPTRDKAGLQHGAQI